MEAIYTFYINPNEKGFIDEAPVTEPADGLIAVQIADTIKDDFLENYNRGYYYNEPTNDLIAPYGHLSVSTSYLKAVSINHATTIDEQAKTIADQNKKLADAQSTVEDLETKIEDANTQLKQLADISNATTLQLMAAMTSQPATSTTETEAE